MTPRLFSRVRAISRISLARQRRLWEIPTVEIVHMTDKGRVTIPKKARDKKGYGPGTAFIYVETNNRDVVLRPVNAKPRMSLIARLKRFKGLDMQKIEAHCPPRI